MEEGRGKCEEGRGYGWVLQGRVLYGRAFYFIRSSRTASFRLQVSPSRVALVTVHKGLGARDTSSSYYS